MGYGYWNKILRINLSNGNVEVEQPDERLYKDYIGGRGFISYYLLKELKPGIDPLGPDNKLIFANGALTGAPIGGTGRNSVGAKSPLTGGYGDAEVGGYWGAEFKRTGFDALIVEGKSSSPVYIWINDNQVQIRDATNIWGKTTNESQRLIQGELGDDLIRTAQIGPAGENKVLYSCIINDLSRAAGRCGIGAVMGSKNLKAVVTRGRQPVRVANPDKLKEMAIWLRENALLLAKGLHDSGTSGVVFGLNRAGGLPTRNFRESCFDDWQKIDGRTMRDTILVARRSCWACPVQCKREVKVDSPYQVNPVHGGPEYETVAALGSNCGVSSLEAVAKGHELCSALGLDTISTGATIAFAMECYEKEIINNTHTDGLELVFGNADAMLQLIDLIARRQGIGDLLAEGVSRTSMRLGKGSEEFAMHVNGQEFPMHEPRWKQGMGLGYILSPTGADHCHNIHDNLYTKESSFLEDLKLLGESKPLPVDDLSPDKVKMVMLNSYWETALNCMVFCRQVPLDHQQVKELIKDITGWDVTIPELLKVGERCIVLNRVFNLLQGLHGNYETLPPRCFEPLSAGPLSGVAMSREAVAQARDTYYEMAGWNIYGVPTDLKLKELDIAWAGGLLNR